jgi:hypothetical protein
LVALSADPDIDFEAIATTVGIEHVIRPVSTLDLEALFGPDVQV